MSFSMTERDLDLFQLEELHSDTGYGPWFARRIKLESYAFDSARHSVSAAANGVWGESDILAFFKDGNSRCAVLIEDKLSAAFTTRQAKRYVERGRDLVEKGEANRFMTVLVAPASYPKYVPASDPWNFKLAIEEIEEWFARQQGHHSGWRRNALRTTLDRFTKNASASSEDAARFSLALSTYLERCIRHLFGTTRERTAVARSYAFPGQARTRRFGGRLLRTKWHCK